MSNNCNHATQSITEKDGAKIIYCLDCGKEMHAIKTCSVCGRKGDVALYHIGGNGYVPFCVDEHLEGWRCTSIK